RSAVALRLGLALTRRGGDAAGQVACRGRLVRSPRHRRCRQSRATFFCDPPAPHPGLLGPDRAVCEGPRNQWGFQQTGGRTRSCRVFLASLQFAALAAPYSGPAQQKVYHTRHLVVVPRGTPVAGRDYGCPRGSAMNVAERGRVILISVNTPGWE